jgi:hypothetical protein
MTVSAAFFAVRTEYLFGLSKATAKEKKHASVCSTTDAVDDMRVAAERDAFQKLLPEIEKTWAGIVSQYAGNAKSE